jgi:transposase-like protein
LLALTLAEACQLTHQEGKVSLRDTACRLSISRNTVHKWVRRYLEEGGAGLVDRSRRPLRPRRRSRKRRFP